MATSGDHELAVDRYFKTVRSTDTLLGRILEWAQSTQGKGGDSVTTVLTADHGGVTRRHDEVRDPGNYTIPLFVWRPGVVMEGDLYSLNPRVVTPVPGGSGYAGPQPIRNADLANLVTRLLDLDVVPGSQIGSRHPLRVDDDSGPQ